MSETLMTASYRNILQGCSFSEVWWGKEYCCCLFLQLMDYSKLLEKEGV
jgi:hypothetical protein